MKGYFKTVWKTDDEDTGEVIYKAKIAEEKEDDGEWYDCTEAVYNFAGNRIEEDDRVDVTMEEDEDEEIVTRISKTGGKSKKSFRGGSAKKKYSGKSSKRYSNKNYKSSKKYNKTGSTNSGSYSKGFDKNLSMKQTCMNSAVEAVKVLQGQLEGVDTLITSVVEIYEALYDTIKK